MKKEQMAPEWYCASASHPPARFDSQGLFEFHMREKHPRGFIETQLHALAQRNMRHASQVFTCCPFCSYGEDGDHLTHFSTLRNQDELQHHISSHLLSLAFISLPPLNSGDSSNSESGESSRAALNSRIGQSEPIEHLQFDDVSHDPNTVESPIQPTSDWDWGFVRESLGKRPVTDEDSPDSVLSRLWKMQQKLASKQNLSSEDSVDHQREASNESSPQAPLQEDPKLATMRNPGFRNEIQKSTRKIDGALPSTVAEGDVPLILRYDEAERVQRQTVEDRQKMLGPDHPETLTSLNNLAQALFFKGQYKEAANLYRQALAGREKILGQNHLDTIKSLNNLAQALVYHGQFKAAEDLYRKALVQGEVTLGLEHPYVLQNIYNLGGALRNQGQHSEAEKLYRQALIGREKVLGPEHPDTLQSVNNLGGTFEKMGKYVAAEKLYRQALAAREKVLGPHDADTLQSVHNVAGALQNQGRYTEAETLYRKALAGREKTLGRNHPNTLKSLNNLALALEKQGKYVEAEQLDGDRLYLSAGQAHGVHKGDDYVVYPFHASESATSQTNEAPTSAIQPVKIGWKAKPVTPLSYRKISMRLMESALCQFQSEEVAQQQRFLHLCTENDPDPCIFNVTLNEHNEYEILDESLERIISLPTLPLDTPGSSSSVIGILQHLAMYKYFEGVENRTPSPSFESSFSLLPLSGTGAFGIFDVKHGETWGFTVKNLGNKPLFLAIFNLTPSWQIVNLVSHSGRGDFLVVQPKNEENGSNREIRLQMDFPMFLQSRGKKYCEDIVKVFITSRPTYFPSMVLPEIPFYANALYKPVRSDDDLLLKFLLELTTSFQSQNHAEHEEWATQNFIVHTAIELKGLDKGTS
jgi:tetratricopeptide (TPR) repeat protein